MTKDIAILYDLADQVAYARAWERSQLSGLPLGMFYAKEIDRIQTLGKYGLLDYLNLKTTIDQPNT